MLKQDVTSKTSKGTLYRSDMKLETCWDHGDTDMWNCWYCDWVSGVCKGGQGVGKCGVIVSSKFSSKQVSMNDECDKVTMFATIVSI